MPERRVIWQDTSITAANPIAKPKNGSRVAFTDSQGM